MKAIVVDKNSADGLDYSIQKKIFEENGIEFVLEDCQTEDEIIEKCKDADALLVIYRQITPRIMDALEHCKVILRYGIGYAVQSGGLKFVIVRYIAWMKWQHILLQ